MSDLSDSEFEVEQILGERQVPKKGLQYLVRWKGQGPDGDTWEPTKNLANAKQLIKDFLSKKVSPTKKKSSSKSRSRSRGRTTKSRSRSASRSRSRSRGRASTTKRTVKEVKTETVSETPNQVKAEVKTETVKTEISSPTSQTVTTYSKTTEIRSSSAPVVTVKTQRTGLVQRLRQCVCAPVCQAWRTCCQRVCGCCQTVRGSDYPAIIVFVTITVIMMSFVLQEYVNFEELWASIVAVLMGLKNRVAPLAQQSDQAKNL